MFKDKKPVYTEEETSQYSLVRVFHKGMIWASEQNNDFVELARKAVHTTGAEKMALLNQLFVTLVPADDPERNYSHTALSMLCQAMCEFGRPGLIRKYPKLLRDFKRMCRTTLTLLDRLAKFHETVELQTAYNAITRIFDLLYVEKDENYVDEKTFRVEVKGLFETFYKACTENAKYLQHLYLQGPCEAPAPAQPMEEQAEESVAVAKVEPIEEKEIVRGKKKKKHLGADGFGAAEWSFLMMTLNAILYETSGGEQGQPKPTGKSMKEACQVLVQKAKKYYLKTPGCSKRAAAKYVLDHDAKISGGGYGPNQLDALRMALTRELKAEGIK